MSSFTCAICLSDSIENQSTLNCGHQFCKKCIGGYIDSEGTVWDKDGSMTSTAYADKQSKALAGKAFEGLVGRHRELVIGKDGTVEKLA